jgi:anti-sigma factor RsiW
MNCEEFWSTIPELGDCRDSGHLLECPACAARISRHRELEAGFRAVAAGLRRVEAPPRVEARLRSAFRRHGGTEYRAPSRRWMPALTWATALAVLFSLAAVLVRPRQPEPVRPPVQRSLELAILQPQTDADGFVALPNAGGAVADDAPDEDDVNLVRVEVPRSAMIALGFDVSAERAGELVEADVKLGSDGMARAVRFLD